MEVVDSLNVLQLLFFFPNVQVKLLNKQHIEQLFYKCYFSNVQMTFSLLVAEQSEWNGRTTSLFCKSYFSKHANEITEQTERRAYRAIVLQISFF